MKIPSLFYPLISFDTQKLLRYFIVFSVILLAFTESFAQQIITVREGFPYCEPFETLPFRANTILGGEQRVEDPSNPSQDIDVPYQPKLANSSLELTSNDPEITGFVFIDYPFASNRGVKVSFEYSSYGKTSSEGADGLSFFMFDAEVDPTTFDLGGKGGSLGYAPRVVTGDVDESGLKGAYLGIGFDEFGNFGNYFEGKRYGFLGTNTIPESQLTSISNPKLDLFKHAVVLRGPVENGDLNRNDPFNFTSYEFITGRILNENVIPGVNSKYMSPFGETLYKIDINSPVPVFECEKIGYRKVFINLEPDPITGFYKVNVRMLINEKGGLANLETIHVIKDEPYPFTAPEFLKIGFAASTGGSNNFHNIKNVTVEVSDNTDKEPITNDVFEPICLGDTRDFIIDPVLADDAFVRCIQLFEDEASAISAKSQAESVTSGQDFNCGLSGTCSYEVCNPDNLEISTNYGSFETFIEEDVNGNFTQKIRYSSNGILSSSGEVTVYYTVVDNFGQMSDPKAITINVVPNPEPIITTIDPLEWEQSEIDDIRVLFDAQPKGAGYTYQWYRDGNPIDGAISDSYLATGPSSIGDYTVEVITDLGCFGISNEEIRIKLIEELNPQIPAGAVVRENCDQLGSVRVELDGDEISGFDVLGNQGNEKYRIVSFPGNSVILDWIFLTPGQSIVEEFNLPVGSYIFQIGDQYRSGQPGSDGEPLFRHEIPFEILSIAAPLQIDAISQDPSCFEGQDGSITVSAQDGNGTYTYELIQGGNVISKSSENISQTSFTFSDLIAGNYEVRVISGSRCEEFIPIELLNPIPVELSISQVKNVTCVENDGSIEWIASGGSGTYSFVSLSKNGDILDQSEFNLFQDENVFTTSGLTEGTYSLIVKDDKGCNVFAEITQLVEISPKPSLDIQSPNEICDGDKLYFEASLIESGELEDPIYTWITPWGDIINSNIEIDGITYELIDHDNNSFTPDHLIVTGLTPGDYTFNLELSGLYSCDVKISKPVDVLPLPESTFSTLSTSCFNGSDGQIILESIASTGNFLFTLLEINETNTTGNFSGLEAGQYTIRVQEDGGLCFSEEIVEVFQPDDLQILNQDILHPSCGGQNGSVAFDIVGGTKDYSIFINNQEITNYSYSIDGDRVEILNLSPGNYSLEVIDANLCTISVPNLANLVNDDGLAVSLEPMDVEACFGQNVVILPEFSNPLPVSPVLKWYKDEALTQSISNGTDTDGVNYQIDPSNGELTIESLPEGTRNYYLEISGSGICTLVETAAVTVFPALATSFDVEHITCFGDADGLISVTPSGGNGSYEVSINGGPFTSDLTFDNLVAGDYTFEIQNDLGCTFIETVTVDGPDELIQINTPTIVRASCGLDNGSIQDLQISGGWGDYSVEWRKGDVSGEVLSGNENGITDLAPGTYFLIVTDFGGCIEIFEFEVGQSSDPVYQIVPPINDCVGNDVRIRPIHLAPDLSLPPAAATEVRWYKEPGQVNLIENGPDLDNPAIEYTIDDSDWLNPELLISGLPAGDYTYYFYVVCTGQEIEVEVSIYDTPIVDWSTSPITCFGDTNGMISFTGGTSSDYTYSLDGAAPVDQAAIESLSLPAGDYQLEVFTPAICSQVIDFTIEGPAAPLEATPLTGIDPGCGSANGKLFTTISGGWAPYQIEVFKDGVSLENHSSDDGQIDIGGFSIGEYYLVITDSEGCSITTNTRTLIDGPTQILIEEVEVCANDVATLTPELDPTASNTTFQWYFDQALTQPINSSSVPAVDGLTYQFDSGTGVLTISGFDPNEATFTYFVTASGPTICEGFIGEGVVDVFGIPSGTASVVDEVCFGEGGQITVNATGGSGSYTYSLNGGEFVNEPVFNVPTGTYTVEILSSAGCSITVEDIEVSGPEAPLNATNLELESPTCGLDNGIIRFELSGGYSPYTVFFTKYGGNENSLVVDQAGTVDITEIREGDYRIRVVDNAGCEILVPQEIQAIEVPTQITAEDQSICVGEIATLSPSVPQNITDESFAWYFDANGTEPIVNGSSADGIIYTISPAGELSVVGLSQDGSPYTYYVNATGTGICGIEPKPVQVIVNRIPELRVSNPSVVCDPNGTVDLTQYIEGFNPGIYEYDILSPSGASMQVSELGAVDLSGDYRVSSSVKGSGCWNDPQRIRVIIAEELLVANFEYEVQLGDGTIVSEDTVQVFEEIQFEDLSSGQVILWSWDFGDGSSSSDPNPIHLYEEKGTYTIQLQVIDEFGCISIYEQVIQVSDDYWVKVPNAFTPSRPDGKNNFFKPVFRGIAEMEFYIFTTWGELIHQTNSLEDEGWDGQFKGVEAPNGNYVYRGKFTSRSGQVVEKSGVFTLIR